MTEQEIFDKVSTHLLTQKIRAIDEHGACLYRLESPNQVLRCAVGCLIPDEDYKEELEGKVCAASEFWSILSPEIGNVLKPHAELLATLQIVHDEKSNWENFPTRLIDELSKVAEEHNLLAETLDSFKFFKRSEYRTGDVGR